MTRKQLAVIATRIYEELENIKGLVRELTERGLTGSKKNIRSALPPGDTFHLRAVGSILLNKFPHTAACLEKDVVVFIDTMKTVLPNGK